MTSTDSVRAFFAVDLADGKLELARQWGATHAINASEVDPVAAVAGALAAQAANGTNGVAIRDQLRSIGVAPGQSVVAGSDGVTEALETLADGRRQARYDLTCPD